MMRRTHCEDCLYYEYSDYAGAYCCTVNLDEDEFEKYASKAFSDCPYYRSGDEYKTVRKQN